MDNISVEMLKAGGETTVTVLKSIIDRIWENGDWPQVTRLGNLRIYHIVTIPKVSGTAECGKYRTISFISQKKIRLLVEVCLRVVRPTAYEQHSQECKLGSHKYGHRCDRSLNDCGMLYQLSISKPAVAAAVIDTVPVTDAVTLAGLPVTEFYNIFIDSYWQRLNYLIEATIR